MDRDEKRKRRPFPLLHPFLLHIHKETGKQIYPFNVEIVKKNPRDSNVIAVISLCQCSSLHELKLKHSQPQEFTFKTEEQESVLRPVRQYIVDKRIR